MSLTTAGSRTRNSDDEEIGILLMGVTGHGKSATGNSILGREEFVSEGGWGSVTKTYHVGHTRIDGRTVKVVDIPGFADSDENSSKDKVKLVVTAISKALTKFPNGFHAVLLVVSYTCRLTKEIQDTLKFIFDQFDQKAFKRHGVLVVTNGDAFHRDVRKKGWSNNIRDWLEDNFFERLDACGRRCVLFDNVTEDENVKETQIKQLLREIGTMDNEESLYIPEMCRYRKGDKQAFEKDRKRVSDNEQILSLLGLLKDDLYRAEDQPRRLREESMKQLNEDIVEVKEKVHSMDSKVDQKILRILERLEKDVDPSSGENEIKSNVDSITEAQNELDKENEWGPWWDNAVQGVSDFVAVVDPVLAKGVEAVGAGVKAVGSAVSWLFGW